MLKDSSHAHKHTYTLIMEPAYSTFSESSASRKASFSFAVWTVCKSRTPWD